MQTKKIDIKSINKLPIFFIVGSPRSGTTLLRSIFDAHPNICIPLEIPFLIQHYPIFGNTNNWDSLTIEKYIDSLFIKYKHKFWSFDLWKINKDELTSKLKQMPANSTYADISKIVLLSFKSIFPKHEIKIIGDKNPVYSLHLNTIKKIFPDAKFIHIVRDYRDQIQSMQRVDFGNKLTPLAALRWIKFQKKITQFIIKNQNYVYQIKYEDLVSNPELKCLEIFDFIGIPYFNDVLHFNKNSNMIISTYKDDQLHTYHESLLKPLDNSRIGVWKKTMPEKEIKIADMLVGKWAKKFGYERKYINKYPLLYVFVMPIYIHLFTQKIILLVIKLLPRKSQLKIINKKSIFEKLYTRVYIKLRGL